MGADGAAPGSGGVEALMRTRPSGGAVLPSGRVRPPMTARQVAAIRASLFLGVLVIPAFRPVHLLGDPGAVDPWRDRLILSAVFLAAGASSYLPWVRDRLPMLLTVAASVATVWSVRIAALNAFSAQTVLGLVTVIACVSASLPGRHSMAWYLAVSLAATLAGYAFVAMPHLSLAFVFPHLVTIAFFTWLLAGSRQRAQESLAQSESLRRYMVDQTSDGLVVVDPIARVAVEANSRARELLGLAPGADPAEVAAAAFGTRSWGAIDAVLMLKETSGGTVCRRELVYRPAADRAFHGLLVATQVRYGVKIMLLVRITDVSDRVELARRLDAAAPGGGAAAA